MTDKLHAKDIEIVEMELDAMKDAILNRCYTTVNVGSIRLIVRGLQTSLDTINDILDKYNDKQ